MTFLLQYRIVKHIEDEDDPEIERKQIVISGEKSDAIEAFDQAQQREDTKSVRVAEAKWSNEYGKYHSKHGPDDFWMEEQ